MRMLVGSLTAILVAALALFLVGQGDLAWWVGNLGTFLAVMLILAWVVVFDSRKRWPDVNWSVRLYRVLSFTR